MERPKRAALLPIAAIATIFCCGILRQHFPGIDAAVASPPSPAVAAPQAASFRQVGAPVRSAAVSRRAQDFSATRDLYAFVSDLKPAADAGDAEALWFTYRALEYCFSYAMNPGGYAHDTNATAVGLEPRSREYFVRARALVSSRCAGFSSRHIGLSQTHDAMLAAANAGHLAAKATAIAYANALPSERRFPDSDAQIARLVSDIRRTRDPEAYLALSLLMGPVAQGRQEAFGPISGSEVAAQSWALAACRAGMDCSATSPVMTQYCANAMVCGYQHLNQLVFGALVPAADTNRIETNIRKITFE